MVFLSWGEVGASEQLFGGWSLVARALGVSAGTARGCSHSPTQPPHRDRKESDEFVQGEMPAAGILTQAQTAFLSASNFGSVVLYHMTVGDTVESCSTL